MAEQHGPEALEELAGLPPGGLRDELRRRAAGAVSPADVDSFLDAFGDDGMASLLDIVKGNHG